LRGVRVLVGRARHQASALSAELRRFGADVMEIPFIEIRRPKSFRPFDAALKSLPQYDWLILTSVNGAESLFERMRQRGVKRSQLKHLKVAAIGPATKKAIEREGVAVEVVPEEYVAESVVRSLRNRVQGKRVLLLRAKVARDVIPRELRKAGAVVDVVEAYETVLPLASRRRLRAAMKNESRSPHWIGFTSSSTVKNFVRLSGGSRSALRALHARRQECPRHTIPNTIRLASIGPVTSATLRDFGLPVTTEAREYTIAGLVRAIVDVERWTAERTDLVSR